MTHDEVCNALHILGFFGGWVVSGDEIVVWENEAKQPTKAELKAALKK